ncbi:MAG TPA: hypothetical protein VGL77_01865 [Armatimonadota bacterium]|jgi:hypothetical protein
MFERRHQPLLSIEAYHRRLARFAGIALLIVLGSLLLGILGYHAFGGLPWIDALVNAAMILAGMGPVNALDTTGGKVFAAAYALFSGIVFLLSFSVVMAPVAHRFLHHFHLEISEDQREEED